MFDFLRRKDAPGGQPPVHPAAVPAAVPESKASAAGRLSVWPAASGRPAQAPRDTTRLTQDGFARNPVGFRAVRLIAEAAAALPLVLRDAERRYAQHPVLDLIARPNPSQGRAELLESLYGQLLLTGNGYVEAAGEGGLPAELHVLRSDRMAVVPGEDGWPVAYDYTVGARRHRFAVADVCHVRGFHPQDDH